VSGTSVIIPAAGAGRRFVSQMARQGGRAASATPALTTKVFLLLAGRPVLSHTLARFAEVAEVAEVIVAVPADQVRHAQEVFGDEIAPGRPLRFLAGGDERPESVARALAATDPKTDLVAVHDAVRPMIRPEIIREALRAAAEHGAAVVGRPVDHTIKRVDGSQRIMETVPRQGLWIAQTPQVFRREVIVEAYAWLDRVDAHITDDAQLVETLGREVVMVLGDAANLKITTPEDLRTCEALLAAGWPGTASDGVAK
jgi:2-C-methyl-D-erythritol 4-phosphate cytidylyltransferase